MLGFVAGLSSCHVRTCGSRLRRCKYSWQAKSVCRPSSREMSSLEKVSPGIRPRFFSQKIAQKLQWQQPGNSQMHVGARKRCRALCWQAPCVPGSSNVKMTQQSFRHTRPTTLLNCSLNDHLPRVCKQAGG
jgi:hypothetical protein